MKLSKPMIELLLAIGRGGAYEDRRWSTKTPIAPAHGGQPAKAFNLATAKALIDRRLARYDSGGGSHLKVPYVLTQAGREWIEKDQEKTCT